MYSDMSTRIRACSVPKTASASALESSVFRHRSVQETGRILSDGSGLLIRLCLVLRLLPQLSRLLPGRQRVYGVSAPVLPDVSILLPRDAVPEFSSRWIRFLRFLLLLPAVFCFCNGVQSVFGSAPDLFRAPAGAPAVLLPAQNRRH